MPVNAISPIGCIIRQQFDLFLVRVKLRHPSALMRQIALCRRSPPLTPGSLSPKSSTSRREGRGVFSPLPCLTLLMTSDCRRSLMRIKWAPTYPPCSPHPSSCSHTISPIGRSLHHWGANLEKRRLPVGRIPNQSMFNEIPIPSVRFLPFEHNREGVKDSVLLR